MAKISTGACVVCDEIRREANGKDIILGAYTAISMSQIPGFLNIAVWVEVTSKSSGALKIDFKIETPGNTQSALASMAVDFPHADRVYGVSTPAMSLFIAKEGIIKFSIRPGETEKWEVLKKIRVEHMPGLNHMGLMQPSLSHDKA